MQQTTKPYVFFDVDGVLNCKDDWRKERFAINPNCLKVFATFIKDLSKRYKTDAILIICSTWRAGFDNLSHTGSPMTMLEKELAGVGLKITDATPIAKHKTRQEEIEYYIRRHDIKDYIIIDDDASLYNDIKRINLYIPDYNTGLVKNDCKHMLKQFLCYNKR